MTMDGKITMDEDVSPINRFFLGSNPTLSNRNVGVNPFLKTYLDS